MNELTCELPFASEGDGYSLLQSSESAIDFMVELITGDKLIGQHGGGEKEAHTAAGAFLCQLHILLKTLIKLAFVALKSVYQANVTGLSKIPPTQ
jgi:hypothetical protein